MLEKILSFFEYLYHNIEIFEKIIDTLRKIWNKIIYLIILLLIVSIPIQFQKFRNLIIAYCGRNKVILVICENYDLLLPITALLIIIVYLHKLWTFGKIDLTIENELKEFVDNIHAKLIHDLRDNIRELDNNLNDLNTNNPDVNNVVKRNMFQSLTNNLQIYVDFLADYLSKYCGCTISVCIKIVKFDNNNCNDAFTIVRSSNTRRNRIKDDESIKIDDNTDFKYLCNGRNTFYGKANLLKEHNKGNYEVTDPVNVWSNKYNSTLIAPIRYFSKHSMHNNVNLDFEILGFLCIDSTKNFEVWEKNDSFELSILAIFADSMYIYLKKYKEIYNMGDGHNEVHI